MPINDGKVSKNAVFRSLPNQGIRAIDWGCTSLCGMDAVGKHGVLRERVRVVSLLAASADTPSVALQNFSVMFCKRREYRDYLGTE